MNLPVSLSLLIVAGLLISSSKISASEERRTITVPILWPVVPGTNRISSHPFQKTLYLQKEYSYLTWYKCIAYCHSRGHDPIWQRIARLTNKGVIHYYNGTDSLYTLFNNGILEIRDVTVADNYTEYRSEVRRAWDLDPEHVLLLFYENEASKQRRTNRVPILWPVAPGPNRISSHPFQEALYFQEEYSHLTWHKCIAHCHSRGHDHIWQRIAKMNNKGAIRYYNGADALYTLLNNGILEIRNVTVADNYTEYRSEVGSTGDLDPEHILLLYDENEAETCLQTRINASSPKIHSNSTDASGNAKPCNSLLGWKVAFVVVLCVAVAEFVFIFWKARQARQVGGGGGANDGDSLM